MAVDPMIPVLEARVRELEARLSAVTAERDAAVEMLRDALVEITKALELPTTEAGRPRANSFLWREIGRFLECHDWVGMRRDCPECEGKGGVLVDSMILYGIPGGEDWDRCPTCKGTGFAPDWDWDWPPVSSPGTETGLHVVVEKIEHPIPGARDRSSPGTENPEVGESCAFFHHDMCDNPKTCGCPCHEGEAR